MIKRTLKNRAIDSQQDWLRYAAGASAASLMRELGTTAEGIARPDDIDRARAFYGANTFDQAGKTPLPLGVLKAFADPFTYILIAIAAVSVATDWLFVAPAERDLTTPLIIAVMVVVSGILRFVQNERSSASAEALAQMIETCAVVEREGDGGNEIPADEIVVGDVVLLGSGAVVPADLRIIEARDLFVSQSSLTGESEPVEKRAQLASDAEAQDEALTDLSDIAFMGSTVISGTGRGVVVATGARTMFGEVAGSVARTGTRRTASGEGIASISRLLMGLMAAVLPIVFIISGVTKGDWLSALLFSLSVAVGLTPEMLPMLVTTCLAKGAVDLSHDRVIVKRLDAIQDLGGIDVLCTDKTGTLTEDHVVLERYLDAMGAPSERVLRCAYLNSKLSTGAKNLIDRAIIERGEERGADAAARERGWRVVDELPFDFERRRLSVVVEDDARRRVLVCKGALAELMEVCGHVEIAGERHKLTDELCAEVAAHADRLEQRGMRVLGLAVGEGTRSGAPLAAEDERDLTLMGYLAFLDPPKQSAAAAVAALAEHGVATKVLTGDAAAVAACTCEAIGITAGHVLTGPEIEAMDDAELARAAEDVAVFAKLAPAQKARVIAALHAGGHTVGYMGDGANDAAAMRESDCGISVDTAVDVARDAADVILLEKDLMVLEHGIVCGRRTFANMLKYVKMTVASNFGNIISVLAAALFLPFLPMGAVQLLLLNLIYDITCTAMPWDCVDDELVARPMRWDTASVRSFMFTFGPVSSLFDIATFALLFWAVCPAVAGGAWGSLDAVGQVIFAATFQAGWFVESMWTQTLVVHLVRSERMPFVGSRAAWPLVLMGALGIALVTILPETPVAAALDMAALPTVYWPVLAVLVAGFVAVTLLAKRLYIRRTGSLL